LNKQSTHNLDNYTCQSTNFTSSSLNFVPYDERENFSNFIKRLDIFMKLKNISDSTLKTYTLLHALTPLIHQKLYDLCAPDDPLSKSYTDLIDILKNYLDPQASTLALQHTFIMREQFNGESVIDFSTELKKMSVNCKFNCSCGKSVCDLLLRLQFIRGIKDSEIRTRLLQEREVKPFKDIVDTATAIELSKTENVMITTPKFEHSTNQIKYKKPEMQQQYKRPQNSSNVVRPTKVNVGAFNFQSLKGKCYRCGDENHRANFCSFINSTCHTCKKEGHIARVCLSKNVSTNMPSNVHNTEENVGIDESFHEIHVVSDKRVNDKFNVTITIEKTIPKQKTVSYRC
jgi:hypothetical protein